MNLSPAVAEWLRAEGHDAVHLRELGLQKLGDASVLARAAAEQRIVATFDLDFGDILAASGSAAVSVILFRLPVMTNERVIGRLRTVIATAGDALSKGAVVVVEETRLRVRSLPIGS